ncbi:hypothetical protein [Variovorax sp. HW608]|uniref:hypothetical protein n=1 Tax=Variovorax sp. HW608 TaxID=1034889 RepID=UPI000B5ABE99|nr:hypothetical protein [Variovorax sp. HW608]
MKLANVDQPALKRAADLPMARTHPKPLAEHAREMRGIREPSSKANREMVLRSDGSTRRLAATAPALEDVAVGGLLLHDHRALLFELDAARQHAGQRRARDLGDPPRAGRNFETGRIRCRTFSAVLSYGRCAPVADIGPS